MMVTDGWNSGKSEARFVDNASFLVMIGLILVWKSRLFWTASKGNVCTKLRSDFCS